MDKKKILDLLKQKKVQDYTFSVVFFVIFTFFVTFAIRPNLMTAFGLQKELQEVRLKNKEYEETIIQIVNYQSTVEQNRENLLLLDEAVPQLPKLAEVVDEIYKSGSDSGIIIDSISIEQISLKKALANAPPRKYHLTLDMTTSVPNMTVFLDKIIAQRRLKTIESFGLSQVDDEYSTESANMDTYKMSLIVNCSYL